MLFLNPWLLLALAGASIPVIVHLVRRQAAKPFAWGAMRFLMDSLSQRRRRMELEDLLLMAARCLLLALAALAIARPFIPPNSATPWLLVLPAVLLGISLFGGSFVLSTTRSRLLVRAIALLMLGLAVAMVVWERQLNLRRFEAAGRRDVALVIDASTSMTRTSGTRTLFDDALDEARRIVKDAPRGTSFAVILGGPSPQALSSTPVSHRDDVLAQLDGLHAVGGTFRVNEALGMATLVLAEGERPNKDIIVLTDMQRHGWSFDNAGAWKTLAAAWNALPAKPHLLLRGLPQAPALRNAGIASITTGRELTGTDRQCLLRTEVVSTGNQPVMAGELLIEIDGQPIAHEALGLLTPGQAQIIETRHRFTSPGAHVVIARLNGHDDIAGDDHAELVVMVRKALRVVLVDGNPAGSFFERAAGHTALALAPASDLLRGGRVGADFLMDPVVIPAPDLTADMLAGAEVVVLADVPRLPAAIAAALAERTAAGSGLLVLAGPGSDPTFYNAWAGPDGALLPLTLGGESTAAKGVSPSPASFRHAALAWASDERRSDLGAAVIRRWHKSTLLPATGALAATFANGDPFLATRGYGGGRCVVATCAFDARAGNLPARSAFVPLVQDLVAWAAGGGVNWNLDSAWSPSVALDSRSSGGLAASYSHRDPKAERPLLERIDPTIDFNWATLPPGRNVPRDNFAVRWRATLLPQLSGDYQLEAEVDDHITIKIADKPVMEQKVNQAAVKGRVRLEAGKPVAFEALYEQVGGNPHVRLLWTPPGGTRQIIPATAWLPAQDKPAPAGEATDPGSHPRKVAVLFGRRGRELRIDGPAVPGLYQVKLPPDVRESITGDTATTPLPVVVRGDIAESRLDALTKEDLVELRSRIDVMEPKSTADVLAVLSGRGFGREITRLIATAALLLLLLEMALARWVSRSRRAGDDLRIEFGDTTPGSLENAGSR
ncbi:MAG: VWA domain-containing protein [Verrucomicrobia bacterium]|nr:MAG: VWA domain-containing protein [Verrucomicrobiota bacterium]